jgi:hypothetical protein
MRLNLEATGSITKEERRKEVLNMIGKADPAMKVEA